MGICFSRNNADTIIHYAKKGSTRDFSAFWNYLLPFLNKEDLENLAKVSRQFHYLVNSTQSNRKSETCSEIRKPSVEWVLRMNSSGTQSFLLSLNGILDKYRLFTPASPISRQDLRNRLVYAISASDDLEVSDLMKLSEIRNCLYDLEMSSREEQVCISLLAIATASGALSIVKSLLKSGKINVNSGIYIEKTGVDSDPLVKDAVDISPLVLATIRGYNSMMDLLLEFGANPNRKGTAQTFSNEYTTHITYGPNLLSVLMQSYKLSFELLFPVAINRVGQTDYKKSFESLLFLVTTENVIEVLEFPVFLPYVLRRTDLFQDKERCYYLIESAFKHN